MRESYVSGGAPGASNFSTRLVVRDDATQGGAKVSPLRQKSRSRSPTHTTLNTQNMARGVRPHIDREQYSTLNQNNSSPLRQSVYVAPAMSDLAAESMLRQRR
mmetsp:Transcript_25667/g.34275  ORF Transcript_25667/g.34275 Transcript_25667/m.34275 type:complete len:103 (-) Transcript_25667:335-643(-)